MRFRDQDIVFANGSKGQNFEIPTANPLNYFHVISRSAELPGLSIDGKLFLPPADQRKADGKFPLVMVVPGSLGVAASHLAHAEAVSDDGFAAFVLDSFSARDVTSPSPTRPSFHLLPAPMTYWRPGRCCQPILTSMHPGSARRATAAAGPRC